MCTGAVSPDQPQIHAVHCKFDPNIQFWSFNLHSDVSEQLGELGARVGRMPCVAIWSNFSQQQPLRPGESWLQECVLSRNANLAFWWTWARGGRGVAVVSQLTTSTTQHHCCISASEAGHCWVQSVTWKVTIQPRQF